MLRVSKRNKTICSNIVSDFCTVCITLVHADIVIKLMFKTRLMFRSDSINRFINIVLFQSKLSESLLLKAEHVLLESYFSDIFVLYFSFCHTFETYFSNLNTALVHFSC